MPTITGYTAARMAIIEAESIIDGDVVGDDLILTRRDGTPINAGNVRGLQGVPGPTGPTTWQPRRKLILPAVKLMTAGPRLKLANPGTLPAGFGQDAQWSPDGHFLAVAHSTTPYVTVYHFDDTVLTKLTNPATLPIGNALSVSWSPDGRFLVVGHSSSPYITIYTFDEH